MRVREIQDQLLAAGFKRTLKSRHAVYEKNGVKVTMPKAGNTGAPWIKDSLMSVLRKAARVGPPLNESRALRDKDVRTGARVKARIEFVSVPRGTIGTIGTEYDGGFLVTWNLPQLLAPITDAFDRHRELLFLEPA